MRGLPTTAVLAVVAGTATASCEGGSGGFSAHEQPPSDLVGDGSAPCNDLSCRIVDCAARGEPDTVLSGIVYDPAGSLPLYNVFVYVPARPPAPIASGHPTCAPCQAPASGSPLTWATTDASGRFRLTHVPSGDAVPLVLQVGKWRRQIVVPHVDACTDNALLDPTLVRLPAKASEGDMPLIALATGCDAAECFLEKIGIDSSEFTGPAGPGHVHIYGGRYAGMTVGGMGDAYALWSAPDRLLAYDMVLGACECAVYPRDTEGPAYEAMRTYLDGGGRLYTTHFHFNWFAPPTGPIDFQRQAQWLDDTRAPGYSTFFVDTSFPRGQAFADWLDANHLSSAYAQVDLTDTRDSVGSVTGATRWIYGADTAGALPYGSKYLTFNTPVGAPVATQCGRATFSDVHLSGLSQLPGAFPAECDARTDPHGIDERALEFLFFDLASCIQDDTQPPSPLPAK